GAAANRGGGQSRAQRSELVFHGQWSRADHAFAPASTRTALCGLSADTLPGRTTAVGLGRDDLLRQGKHRTRETIRIRGLLSGGASVPRRHPENPRRRRWQGLPMRQRDVGVDRTPATHYPSNPPTLTKTTRERKT